MARYSKILLSIPEGVEVKTEDRLVMVKGEKGKLQATIPPGIIVAIQKDKIAIKSKNNEKENEKFIGLLFHLTKNMIVGVTKGFEKELELNGVGYKMSVKGQIVNLQLGYSHDILYHLPEGVTAKVDGNKILIKGIDKEIVGRAADKIRGYRPVEPYKAKGFKYTNEVVIRKAGKSSA